MGEEISIYMAFFVWHFKIALPSFYGIPTNESIIFSTFRAANSPSSGEMQIRPFKSPTD